LEVREASSFKKRAPIGKRANVKEGDKCKRSQAATGGFMENQDLVVTGRLLTKVSTANHLSKTNKNEEMEGGGRGRLGNDYGGKSEYHSQQAGTLQPLFNRTHAVNSGRAPSGTMDYNLKTDRGAAA